MKLQDKHFYTLLGIRRSGTGNIQAVDLFPAVRQRVYHSHRGRWMFYCKSQPSSRGQFPVIYPLMTCEFTLTNNLWAHSNLSSPDPCPDPCPVLLLTTVSAPSWALHLAGCMCWFGLVLLGEFCCHKWPWASPVKCIFPSSAQLLWALQRRAATALLLPPPPCSQLTGTSLPVCPILPCPCAVLCALTKAAALTRMHLLSLACCPFSLWFFSQPCSAAAWMHPHAGGICICQGASCCCRGMAAAAPGLAISSCTCVSKTRYHSVLQHRLLCHIRPPSAISALVMPAPTSTPFSFLIP